MNDLPCASNLFHCILYADDTTLFSTIGYSIPLQNSNVNDQLNHELLQAYEWLAVNKLSLNINKTKFMVFHPYQKDTSQLTPTLKINNMEIERVSNLNFLGVILDECLTWKPHIEELAIKLSRNAGILNKHTNLLPSFIMKTLYFSLSHSHLNYGILIGGYKCNRLVKLQKRLIRIVMLAKYNAHTDPLFKQAAILKISDMLRINVLKFYHKCQRRKLPKYFYNFNLTTQGPHHSYDTHSSELIRTDRTRAEFCDNKIRIFLPKVITQPQRTCYKKWNSQPSGLLVQYKRYILDEYTEICSVANCYIYQRTWKKMFNHLPLPFSTLNWHQCQNVP